jgi:hypothetical protein
MRLDVHVTEFESWLSMRENSYLIDSFCDETVSAHAQHVIKSFPRMLSQPMPKRKVRKKAN